MRIQAAAACFALLLVPYLSAAEDAAGEEDDLGLDDLDLDLDSDDGDEFGSGGDPGGMPPGTHPQGEPVEDFDLGMPEEDRKKRMQSCFTFTVGRVQTRKQQLEETVKQMTSGGGPPGGQEMTPEQAVNTLVFSWMMACYMNIDDDGIRKGAVRDAALTEDMERDLFSQRADRPQQVQQASRQQWQLLEGVLKEQQDLKETFNKPGGSSGPSGGARGGAQGGGGAQRPTSPWDGSPAEPASANQWLYVIGAFGCIFGVVALVIWRLVLMQQGNNGDKERSAKSAKKADKAEKKLAKKRI